VTCRELAGFLDDYLAGSLPAHTTRAFDLHLARCSNCRRYLAGYRESVRLGRRAFDDDLAAVPPEVPDQLLRGILSARLAH
jgi:anti-sigma factor RsiW